MFIPDPVRQRVIDEAVDEWRKTATDSQLFTRSHGEGKHSFFIVVNY